MHCKVDGNAFAAAMDRQKTDMSLVLNAGLPGAILSSLGIFSVPEEPEKECYTCKNAKLYPIRLYPATSSLKMLKFSYDIN